MCCCPGVGFGWLQVRQRFQYPCFMNGNYPVSPYVTRKNTNKNKSKTDSTWTLTKHGNQKKQMEPSPCMGPPGNMSGLNCNLPSQKKKNIVVFWLCGGKNKTLPHTATIIKSSGSVAHKLYIQTFRGGKADLSLQPIILQQCQLDSDHSISTNVCRNPEAIPPLSFWSSLCQGHCTTRRLH